MGGHSRFIFQSTLPVWGATRADALLAQHLAISIHAPRVGSDFGALEHEQRREISIHAPRVGSDHAGAAPPPWHRNFNPRSPCGERPVAAIWIRRSGVFQSTLPVWGATRRSPRRWCRSSYFNPRSPCGERPLLFWPYSRPYSFQSTLPVWGATRPPHRSIYDLCHFNPRSPCGERLGSGSTTSVYSNFNPRSPCGERPVEQLAVRGDTCISIHAPRVGSDRPYRPEPRPPPRFQSTLPVWGATFLKLERNLALLISIHAPRVGSDAFLLRRLPQRYISIHAPRVGSDSSCLSAPAPYHHFNPRSPCGERHCKRGPLCG